ncbi:uncharacterized protein LOC111368773 [Olea europaea var. sylvestris]|uniref:Uncharacterized protein LOC111368773 n=1 Tax=Olea europaea subsp. europaea TaxID=158383 RepID=A0A8S0UC35_OLEEU|nr:uncharacterized protein LOC111368773 [Olea europaea var. sylvestris]CAA3015415.1 uncharacterized protein LOC111368773 [Olea europaea subsp. europaea]
MATGWIKSLNCKSKASDDVVENHHLRRHNSKIHNHHYHRLTSSASCRNSATKDTVNKSKKPEPDSHKPTNRTRATIPARPSRLKDTFFPALSELPVGYPSRNVVEIIFHTSWKPKNFSGGIETIFKVQNLARTVTRFEEYRETVKSKASSKSVDAVDGGSDDHARCIADGNEVMRFHCLGPTNGGVYDSGGGVWSFHGGKGAAICTFSGSGEAHERAGGGRGRRAMLVCRVIAGRIGKQLGFDSLLEGRDGYDSVSGENGELLVFDTRALLPCFLIIYHL